jgi:arylsulfatase A-like enzyme
MVTSDPSRTPTFTMFGNPDYFNQTAGNTTNCSQSPPCVVENPAFAWNHGDVQQEITRTWLGLVGPGVRHLGRNDEVFSDHTDIRPTLISLAGLTDDYTHDGRVLVEFLDDHALPGSLKSENFLELARVYKQLNAPLGSVGMNSLVLANRSILADDTVYGKYLKTVGDIAADRDELAAEIKKVLKATAFENQLIDEHQEELLSRARKIIDRVADLANNGH